MANNKIGSNSSSKSEGKSDGNGEVAEPKKTLKPPVNLFDWAQSSVLSWMAGLGGPVSHAFIFNCFFFSFFGIFS